MTPETNQEWVKWGEADPLWGVASWPGHARGQAQEWTDAAFYELGRSDWQAIEALWRSYGFDPSTVVDVGCGTGRLTHAIAGIARTVYGVDVAPGMLDYARKRIEAANVHWLLSDGARLPLDDESVTAVTSFHVWQHMPSPAHGLAYLTECLRVLEPGGTLLIHLPLHSTPNGRIGRLALKLVRFGAVLSRAKSHIKRLQMRFGGKPFLHGISYEMPAVMEHLRAHGCTRVEVRCFFMNGLHTCILATKG